MAFLAVGLSRALFVRRPEAADPLVDELRADRRFERWLLVREALIVLAVAGVVLLRASLS
ncbi:MAG TPA: hypothetical protein VIL49_14370 [Capillimicrobium sp.]